MSLIWCNVSPSVHGGGPSVFVHKFVLGAAKKGHKVIFDKVQRADVALCVINSNKVLGKAKKIVLRIDGIYNKLYNEKFGRAVRGDMVALHKELAKNIPLVDHVVYQSQWSKDRIDDEIVVRNKNYSIIHNAVDTNIFRPIKKDNSVLNLIHVGRIRDAYIIEVLVGVYKEVVRRGRKTNLILVGNMDGPSSNVYKKYKRDGGIIHIGPIPNNKLSSAYAKGHIFLDVRQGASSNNVVAESQACGNPVVTPSWGGSKEMVSHKKTGVIVDGGKWDYDQKYVQNISNAVEYIMDNYVFMSKEARQFAIEELTVDKMVDKYLAVMDG